MAEADRARTVTGLQRLREGLDRVLPRKTLDDTMLLGTWNIRELDSSKYGERTDEAYLYLAEIVSRFDVVAVQEVRNDLGGLRRLNAALGPHWRWIVTDVTAGRSGNGERMSFLYDTRTVEFTGLASELVLNAWGVQLQVDSVNDARVAQFIDQYRLGPQTPEFGASCDGGVGRPIG